MGRDRSDAGVLKGADGAVAPGSARIPTHRPTWTDAADSDPGLAGRGGIGLVYINILPDAPERPGFGAGVQVLVFAPATPSATAERQVPLPDLDPPADAGWTDSDLSWF